MKNSGIEWIGEIPDSWDKNVLVSVFTEHKQKNLGLIENNLLSLSYGKIVRKDIETAEGLLPASFETYNIIDKDDIIFRLTDLQNDQRSLRTALCHEKGIITSAYVTLRAIVNVSSKYMHYLFYSYDICRVFYGLGAGIRQGMNFSDLKKLPVLMPHITEQQKIAEVLDEKCGRIDKLIENEQKQIEKMKEYKQSVITSAVTKGLDPTVPMKDSGIDWIGVIPESWTLNRIKYVCEFNPKNEVELNPTDIVGYVPMECIKNGYMENREILVENISSGLTFFADGDIVMAKVTPCFENGNIAIAQNLPKGLAFGSSELFVFRPKKIYDRWLFYFLRNNLFMEYAKATMTGTGGLKRVSPNFVYSLAFACPSIIEQQGTADYLDKKCGKIDEVISIKQRKIEKLQEYKKSLIYEYVTGKKQLAISN